MLSIVGCPVSGYFKKGKIKLLVDETYWRGTPKTGSGYKLASNYGPSVYISSRAEKNGYSQSIWTYDEMMLESGASNLFFLIKNKGQLELITHPLDGCILPGITRDSIINLVPEFFPEMKVIERPFKIPEFIERHRNGELVEVFMTGTAAVISHVD